MKKSLIIVLLLSLVLNGFSQNNQRLRHFFIVFGGTTSYRIATVPMKVKTTDGTTLDAKRLHFLNIKNAPPVLGGGHLGFNATCFLPKMRFGFDVMVNYHRFGVYMTYPGYQSKTSFVTNSVVPEIDLRIELRDKKKNPSAPIPVAYLGAAYNYHFTYSGLFDVDPNKLNAVNNGFEGVVGIGIQYLPAVLFSTLTDLYNNEFGGNISNKRPSMSIALLYRLNFYDYFNQDYYHAGTAQYPFNGFTSRFGEVFIRLTGGW